MTRDEWLRSEDVGAMLRFLDGEVAQTAWTGESDPRRTSNRKLRLFACACCRMVWDKLVDDAECGRCDGSGGTGYGKFGLCPDCHGAGRINRSRRAVEVAEKFADGLATKQELEAVRKRAIADMPGSAWTHYLCGFAAAEIPTHGLHNLRHIPNDDEPAVPPSLQADILRSIVGDPSDPVRLPQTMPGLAILGWPGDPQVHDLAQAAYEEQDGGVWVGRSSDHDEETGWVNNGSLDPARLAVLSDALEEAGCDDERILRHLRGEVVCWQCGGAMSVRESSSYGYSVDPCKCRAGAGYVARRVPFFRGDWVLDLILGRE